MGIAVFAFLVPAQKGDIAPFSKGLPGLPLIA
jgi:hypothetical protein